MLLRQRFLITLAAIVAALIPAHASAAVIASCAPTPPSQALNGGTNPLAETFTTTAEYDVATVDVVAADTGGGGAQIALVATTADGAPDETHTVAAGAVHLPADPGPVAWTPADPIRLEPGTYAIVLHPAGVLAWERCAAMDGGWFRDGDGNWNQFPMRRLTFAIEGQPADHTPPAITFGPLASPTRATAVDVAFDADEHATFTCSVDAAEATACTSPLHIDGIGEGHHVVRVVATDRWGNASAPAAVDFTIDRTPPVVTLTASAPQAGSHAIGLEFSADEAATFTCGVSDDAGAPCASPTSLEAPAEGQVSVAVSATDAAGNTATATDEVLADWTAPELELPADIDVTADRADGAVVTFSAGAGDHWDPSVTAECTPESGTRFPVGDSLVLCTATDASGNAASGSFGIHVAAPPNTAAEFDVAFDADTGRLVVAELHGGSVAGGGGDLLTATAAGHSTVAQLRCGDDHRRRADDDLSISSLAYDGAAPVQPDRNAYHVRIRRSRDGGVRRIMLRASAGGETLIVRYRADVDLSTVWHASRGHRSRVAQVQGLVIPHLRTAAGSVAVTLA